MTASNSVVAQLNFLKDDRLAKGSAIGEAEAGAPTLDSTELIASIRLLADSVRELRLSVDPVVSELRNDKTPELPAENDVLDTNLVSHLSQRRWGANPSLRRCAFSAVRSKTLYTFTVFRQPGNSWLCVRGLPFHCMPAQ